MLIHKAKSAWFSQYGTICGITRGEMSPFDADASCPDCNRESALRSLGKAGDSKENK